MAHTPPPLPATFTDQTGYRWSLLASLDSLPAACAPMLLALFRPSAQEAGATIVLSAGKTATPLACAAVRSTVNHGVSRNGAPIQGGGQPDGIVRGTGRAQQAQRVRDRSGGRSRGGARGHPDHAGGLPAAAGAACAGRRDSRGPRDRDGCVLCRAGAGAGRAAARGDRRPRGTGESPPAPAEE